MHIDHKRLRAKAASPSPIEYPAMIASLFAAQAIGITAIAQTHYRVAHSIDSSSEQAIVTLLQARPGWRAAATALEGSFHPAIAKLIG